MEDYARMILNLCERLDTTALEGILTHCAWHKAHNNAVQPPDGYRAVLLSAIAQIVPLLPENGLESVHELTVQYNSR